MPPISHLPVCPQERAKIKVKLRMNLHCIMSVESVQALEEEEEVDEAAAAPEAAAEAPKADVPMADAEAAPAAEEDTEVRYTVLVVACHCSFCFGRQIRSDAGAAAAWRLCTTGNCTMFNHAWLVACSSTNQVFRALLELQANAQSPGLQLWHVTLQGY